MKRLRQGLYEVVMIGLYVSCATVHLPQLDLNRLVKPRLRLFVIQDTEKTRSEI